MSIFDSLILQRAINTEIVLIRRKRRYDRDYSIITSRIEGVLVSAFFVMLGDGKQEVKWNFMKGQTSR